MTNLSVKIQNAGASFKEAATGFSEAVKKYTAAFKKFSEVYKIYQLKRKASRLAKKTNVDHYVIMWRGRPEVLSRDGFKYMRQREVFPQSFTAANLKEIAIYHAKAKA